MQALLERRHRRRPGDDLQRVRAGARGEEPGDRQAVHSRPTSTSSTGTTRASAMLQDAIWANTDKLAATRRTRTQTIEVHQGVASRAGSTAATTPRSAATSSSAKGSKLGASHQLWQMNEINKLIWPAAERRRHDRPGRVGRRPSSSPMSTKNLDGRDRADQGARRAWRTRTTTSTRRSRELKADGVDVNGTSLHADDRDPEEGRRMTSG